MSGHTLLSKARKAVAPVTKAVEGVLGPNDPLAAARGKNQKAENKLRKLRIKNRIKRGGPGSEELGGGLRKRMK